MRYLYFDNNDKIPALGLGTWKAAKGEVYTAVRKAIEIGYRHFDCAWIYGNEAEIGQALYDSIINDGIKREDLFITSKLWNNAHRADQIEPTCIETLKNLKLDYLDLYLIHWPIVLQNGVNFPENGNELVAIHEVPLAETWQGLIKLKQSAFCKHIGVSNFNELKINDLFDKTNVMPEVNQIESHPFLQQEKLLNFCKGNNILLTAYCPLGSADRPATRIVANEPKLFKNDVLIEIATRLGFTPAQIMLAWAVNRGTIVIPKSVNSERLKENLLAADIELSCIDMDLITGINLDYRYIKGDFWCIEGSPYTVDWLWNG